MNLWTMIVAVVALGVVSEMYRARLKVRSRMAQHGQEFETLQDRLDKLEQRMANLETIILEHEKDRAFDASLSGTGSRRGGPS